MTQGTVISEPRFLESHKATWRASRLCPNDLNSYEICRAACPLGNTRRHGADDG